MTYEKLSPEIRDDLLDTMRGVVEVRERVQETALRGSAMGLARQSGRGAARSVVGRRLRARDRGED
jgi:hypothetical protein